MTKFKVLWRTCTETAVVRRSIEVERLEIIVKYHKLNKVMFSSDVFVGD